MGDDSATTFDADAWGASPNGDTSAERSVYDDDLEDDELVPLARSLLTFDTD